MTPDQFDALMDLIDHKIATAIKHGAGFKTKVLSEKQSALREVLSAENESVPKFEPLPKPKTRSELEAEVGRLWEVRAQIEISDDRAYSNGRMAKINDEIAAVRKTLAELEE